jgi:hypothetical protein
LREFVDELKAVDMRKAGIAYIMGSEFSEEFKKYASKPAEGTIVAA